MAECIKYEVNSNIYDKIADKKLNIRDFPSAAEALKEAIKLNPDEYFYSKLAELYCEVGSLKEATQVLVDMHIKHPKSMESILGLYRIAVSCEDSEASYYYLGKLVRDFELSDELLSLDDYLDEISCANSNYRLISSDDIRISLAEKNMEKKSQTAIALLEGINKTSDKFIPAREQIAIIRLIKGDADGAYLESLNILKYEPNNLNALSFALTLSAARKDSELVQEYSERINKLEVTEPEDLSKLAISFCEAGKHELAIQNFEKMLDKKYDRNIMQLMALAYYNSNKINEAVKTFKDMFKLYGRHCPAIFYLDYIAKKPQNELPYLLQESFSEILLRKDKLLELLNTTDENLINGLNGSDFRNLIYWFFCNVEDEYAIKPIVKKLVYANNTASFNFLNEILKDVYVEDIVKKVIIEVLIYYGYQNKLEIYMQNIIFCARPIYPRKYEEIPGNFKCAYGIAFSEICNSEAGFEYSLKTAFLRVLSSAHGFEKKLKSEQTLAAFILIETKLANAPINFKESKEILNINRTTYNKYNELLGGTYD